MQHLTETKIRVAGIIIRDEKILMLVGKGYAQLWTPGGKKEGSESDKECLKREFREELGVKLTEEIFFKEYFNHSFYDPERKMIERIHIVKIQGELRPAAEIESIVWLTKEDFANKKFPMITHDEMVMIPDLMKEGIW